ncbi:uncharacterized protein LOC127250981 [Andrographis paniculata]|uniref:uncharacterized protein LOC127250981 n=1 Tax=Andrographis paniculata TaxID=175694 RepID=UPI0021E915DA|nr:uncharacterized protein LOC127250981 [Andrographis paniculata]
MAEEEAIAAEVEAVKAVYGEDCRVIEAFPPHLCVHLKPRTAEVSSQQFVEATIGIHAGSKYPEVPPDITIIDSKGLDEQRQKHLIARIQDKASELASCLMLVALCEEAVERLSTMNHPEGDCPLCLYPLLDENAENNSLPFMKLMSCFHCFHCNCIIRWWNWTKMQNGKESSHSSSSIQDRIDTRKVVEGSTGKCPVCRKVFLKKDIKHVLGLVENFTHLDFSGININEDVLQSDSEKIRKQKFDAILKLQQENNGLIEPKKEEVLQPGMFLPQPITVPSTQSANNANPESSVRISGSRRRSNSARKQQNPRKQVSQWVRKEHPSED